MWSCGWTTILQKICIFFGCNSSGCYFHKLVKYHMSVFVTIQKIVYFYTHGPLTWVHHTDIFTDNIWYNLLSIGIFEMLNLFTCGLLSSSLLLSQHFGSYVSSLHQVYLNLGTYTWWRLLEWITVKLCEQQQRWGQ